MIELELKYKLNKIPDITEKISDEKEVEDIYYDTSDYKLIRKGNFLRLRNKKSIDFKLSTNDLTHLFCKETNFSIDKFKGKEITEVLNNIGVNIEVSSFDELIKALNILAPIKKHRKVYQLEPNVVMVIDKVEELGIFLEIEYDIDKESITQEEAVYYKKYLVDILKKKNLISDADEEIHVGYVELYLKKYNMNAYNLGLYKWYVYKTLFRCWSNTWNMV